MAKVETELAKHLRDNIRYLASLIPRQHGPSPTGPASLSAWASTPDEAFSIPADSSKVGWALSYSEILASLNWPFPAYIDLKSELPGIVNGFQAQQGRLGKWREKRRLNRVFALANTDFMSAIFRTYSRKVFEYWKASPVFKSKLPILAEIELA